jgi:HSP20 family molecular chaperone IbpA
MLNRYFYDYYVPSTSALALLRLTDELLAASNPAKSDMAQNGDEDQTVTLDLPGYKREEIAVEATHDGVVTITAQNDKRGLTTRQYYLDGLDSEQVEAALSDGVLTLTLKRAESAKPRKIAVK